MFRKDTGKICFDEREALCRSIVKLTESETEEFFIEAPDQSLEETSAAIGATRRQTLRYVTSAELARSTRRFARSRGAKVTVGPDSSRIPPKYTLAAERASRVV